MKIRIGQSLTGAFSAFAVIAGLTAGACHANIVPFDMLDVGIYPGAPPTSLVVTTGEQIPGGINNSGAGNEFNLSSVQFDIDGDLEPGAEDPSVFYDFQVRTASFAGGQIVFDGFTHLFTPGAQNGSFVVTKNDNSYLNFPFFDGEIIGDGIDEFIRDGFSPPGPPNNQTFSVALDEGGAVRFFEEGIDNFVGFKLDTGYYGWIRVQFDSTAGEGKGSLTFLDGAYNDTGAPIAAGDVGSGNTDNANFVADGAVDGRDFLVWQRHFGLVDTASQGDGDATGDMAVNGFDLAVWQNQFGPVGAAQAIPEPAALSLAAWMVAAAVKRRAKISRK